MKICLTLILIALICSTASAATFNVINLNDSDPGSLRQAIADANNTAGDDVINFQPGSSGTIQLTSGEILINSNIAINGSGVNTSIISGNNSFRILNIAANSTVSLNDLTVRGGRVPTGTGGGGILNAGILTTSNLKVIDNSASNDGFGIGIASTGTMTLSNSTVSNNTGSPTLGPFLGGGGIYNRGTAQIIDSTISANVARFGGGIYNFGALTIKNSTVYGNRTQGGGNSGGGITQTPDAVSMFLVNCTIASNASSSDVGSGIISPSGKPVTLYNTIVANNTVTVPQFQVRDVSGTVVSQGYNLISNSTNSNGWIASDKLNQDARLGSFSNAGGFTETVALISDSPAVDAGGATDLTTDQRGFQRPIDSSAPNAPGGNGTDIGAYELQTPAAASVTIGGRVLYETRGLSNAVVSLTDLNGATRSARTNSLGYYRFEDVSAGETCVLSVSSKRYSFDSQVVTVTEEVGNLNFIALP